MDCAQLLTIPDAIFLPINYYYSPVSSFGASTGFDWGDPYCRRNIDRTTIAKTDRNSPCQFWKDSNQNLEPLMYCEADAVAFPCNARCAFSSFRPPWKCTMKEAGKSRSSAMVKECF